jgi:hypothetical protein
MLSVATLVRNVPNSDIITLSSVLARTPSRRSPLVDNKRGLGQLNRLAAESGCSIPSDILLSCYEVGSPTVRPCKD